MTNADFDQLAMLSDLSIEDYMNLKDTLLGKGQSMRLWKILRSRCRFGIVRNLECPPVTSQSNQCTSSCRHEEVHCTD